MRMAHARILLLAAAILTLSLVPAVGDDAPKAPSKPRREVAPPPREVAPKTMGELLVGTWKVDSKKTNLKIDNVTFEFSEDGALTLRIPDANIGPKIHSGMYRLRDNVLELNYQQSRFIDEKQILIIKSIDNRSLILTNNVDRLFLDKLTK